MDRGVREGGPGQPEQVVAMAAEQAEVAVGEVVEHLRDARPRRERAERRDGIEAGRDPALVRRGSATTSAIGVTIIELPK